MKSSVPRGDRSAQKLLMVLRQATPDFPDRKHDRRCLFAENWGTFLLVLVAARGGVVAGRSVGVGALAISSSRSR